MTSYPPYANSHVAGPKGQASKSNVQLQNLSVVWPILQTYVSTAINLHADPANTNLVTITGAWLVTDLDCVAWVDVDAGTPATDETTDAASAGAGDVALMAASEAIGDYILFGHNVPFGALELIIGTAGVGGVGTWEYLAGDGNWKTFSFLKDGSGGLLAAATDYVQWEFPEDWGANVITLAGLPGTGRTSRYWVRFRITTVYSTNPVGSRIRCYPMSAAAGTPAASFLGGVKAPATGMVSHLHTFAGTASAANNDTILEIINLTGKTRGRVTVTKAIQQGRYELSTKLRVTKGDLVIIRGLQEDGTTEFQTVALALEIAA